MAIELGSGFKNKKIGSLYVLPNFTYLSLRGYTWSKAHLLAMTAQGIDNKAMFTHLKYLDLQCKSEKSWL